MIAKKKNYNKKWLDKNPDYFYKHNIKRRYGISSEEYDILLETQNGVCKICKQECDTGRRLCVDHCHATGRIRGLLCNACNTGLGSFRDSIKLLSKAIGYLEDG